MWWQTYLATYVGTYICRGADLRTVSKYADFDMIEVGVKTQNHTQTWKIFEQEQEQVKRNIAERCLLVSLCFRILKKTGVKPDTSLYNQWMWNLNPNTNSQWVQQKGNRWPTQKLMMIILSSTLFWYNNFVPNVGLKSRALYLLS